MEKISQHIQSLLQQFSLSHHTRVGDIISDYAIRELGISLSQELANKTLDISDIDELLREHNQLPRIKIWRQITINLANPRETTTVEFPKTNVSNVIDFIATKVKQNK